MSGEADCEALRRTAVHQRKGAVPPEGTATASFCLVQ